MRWVSPAEMNDCEDLNISSVTRRQFMILFAQDEDLTSSACGMWDRTPRLTVVYISICRTFLISYTQYHIVVPGQPACADKLFND